MCAVAKWLRNHDPPAPWDHQVCDSIIAAGAKAAGYKIVMDSEEESKEYKPGDPALDYQIGGTIRNLQMPLIVEMADWLMSEGVPRADRLASVSDTLPSPSPIARLRIMTDPIDHSWSFPLWHCRR